MCIALFGDEVPMTAPSGPRVGRSVARIDPADGSLHPLVSDKLSRLIDVRSHHADSCFSILDFGQFERHAAHAVVAQATSGTIWRTRMQGMVEVTGEGEHGYPQQEIGPPMGARLLSYWWGEATKKRIPSCSQEQREYPPRSRNESALLPRSSKQRNTISRGIAENSPPTDMGNFSLGHDGFPTMRFNLGERCVDIIGSDVDQQAVRSIL